MSDRFCLMPESRGILILVILFVDIKQYYNIIRTMKNEIVNWSSVTYNPQHILIMSNFLGETEKHSGILSSVNPGRKP